MRWALLQLADSAFPTGGFAHSGGLEASLAFGAAPDVGEFARAALWQAGAGALPFVRAAHATPEAAETLDRRCEATLTNHVARRASRLQGRAFAMAAGEAFPELAGLAARHLPVIFGAALRRLEVSVEDTQALYLHGALRGVLSAAVRLGRMGPFEAQRVQAALAPEMSRVLASPVAEPAQTAPLQDLAQALHDHLYTRLFQS